MIEESLQKLTEANELIERQFRLNEQLLRHITDTLEESIFS